MAPLYVVLLHHPVYDKQGRIVTTAVTNMDVHDLARIGMTYGVRAVFIATPVRALRLLVDKIMEHWRSGFGATYNETRRQALSIVRLVSDLDRAILEIEREHREAPVLVATSAREGERRIRFGDLRERLHSDPRPHLLVLGTGWGLAAEIMDQVDLILEPIRGVGDYNHLPVRGAAAIILDRLLGSHP